MSIIQNIIDAVAFRTTRRYNIIHIRSLKPHYYDIDTRLLHGMMNLLIDYVEIELAALELNSEERRNSLTLKQKIHKCLPWIFRTGSLIRSRELGLAHLAWEKQMDKNVFPEQARTAAIVEELYLWYKDVRSTRKNPDEELCAFFEEWERQNISISTQRKLPDEKHEAELERIFKDAGDLEKQYYDEDTEKLKKLIDIRGYLWT